MIAPFDTLAEFKFEAQSMRLYDSLSDELFNKMMLLSQDRVEDNGTKIITPQMMKGILKQALSDLKDDKRLE